MRVLSQFDIGTLQKVNFSYKPFLLEINNMLISEFSSSKKSPHANSMRALHLIIIKLKVNYFITCIFLGND